MILAIPLAHGGNDHGGSGGGMFESKIVMNIGNEVRRLGQLKGWTVLLSKENESDYLSPSEQLAFINNSKADMSVAIHVNDSANEKAKGAETIFRKHDSFKLAKAVQSEFVALGQENRGVKADVRGLAVLKGKCPCILVEPAFLTLADINDINELKEQHAFAAAIIRGVEKCIQ